MKKNIYFLFLMIIFQSCGSSKTVNTSYNKDGSTEKTITQSNVFGKKDILKLKEEWNYEMLIATGEAPVVNKYDEVSRNKQLARRGAILDAQRNLSEKIGVIRLNSNTTMMDFSTNDIVQSKINVLLKNVTVLSEEYDEQNKSYKVTVQMPKLNVVNVLEEYFNN